MALCTIAALGVVALSTGCQSPGVDKGLRLPGTPNLPATHLAPTPHLTPGGKTPKVPGVDSAAAWSQPIDDANAIAQVGFVGRLTDRIANRCGSCQGCVQGGDCNQCTDGTLTFVPMMGRPVDPQEFLCNGGDVPPDARVLRDDSIGGLEPQDAIVHYTTEAGDIALQASNRVCVYAPRFGAVRQVSGAVAGEKAIGLSGTYQGVGPNGIGLTQPSLIVEDIAELAHADVARRVDAMRDRNRGVPVEGIVQPVLAEDALQILATLDFVSLSRLDESQIAILKQGAVAAQSWMIRDAVEVMIESMQPPVLIRDASVEAFVRYDFPDAGRLQIVKVADKDHAQQGEEITFAIHVQNVGDSAVSKVEIADSLVTRLEYVEESQSCDRQAEFSTSGNAAGSVRLKWSLAEPLAVGETAKIEFKCRVR
ncbi:MAG: DUF11 domain-containing protein [Planctomycetales bacterium]|nr:DUF11 domain-containing protein [Planctomycetales bacterium]